MWRQRPIQDCPLSVGSRQQCRRVPLIQEAPSLHKPVLVLREVTERMEGVDAGVSRLVGTSAHDIYHSACDLASNQLAYSLMQGKNPYGDGHASERISEYLQGALS